MPSHRLLKKPSSAFTCIVLLLACISLSGCSRAAENAQHASNKMRAEGERVDSRVRGWFDTNNLGQAKDEPRHPDTAFCYRTLGDTTCYRQPLPGGDERLTGVQLPTANYSGVSGADSLVPPPTTVKVQPLSGVNVDGRKPTSLFNAPHELTPQTNN